MSMDHLLDEKLPKGIKSLYYEGIRLSKEELFEKIDKKRKGKSRKII